MKLLNVITARSVWLFDLNELNPRGKSLYGELFEWLKDAYSFEKAPSSFTDVDDTKALVFSRGQFQVKEEIFVAVELKIYNDGLIANSWSSTRDTDLFLADTLKSAASEFNLNPDMIIRKRHMSEINVTSERDLNTVNPLLSEFAKKVAALLPADIPLPYEFGGVVFPPTQGPAVVSIAPFKFERKINTAPSDHKFYSSSPTHTDEHLELLNWFEGNLMG